MTNAFARGDHDRFGESERAGGHDAQGFADIAEHRGHTDREPGLQVGINLAFKQVGSINKAANKSRVAAVRAATPRPACWRRDWTPTSLTGEKSTLKLLVQVES
ncbi:hypothetical protein [Saccharomonospora piscinae]|uniref:hypothetical protein n=1 Tax=Saccharomonospora piscinae TaxID=687388 RepID=UPI00141F85D1|nr:hypothetical protein [Saccharomonospora piscinae]